MPAIELQDVRVFEVRKPRMRVVHICDDFVTGGIESVVMDLCGALQAKDIETSVLFLYGRDEYPQRERTAEVKPLGMERRIRMDPRGIARLKSLCTLMRPTVFHCHGYYSALAPILLRLFGVRVPVVYTVHAELQHWGWKSDFLIRRVSRWADVVTALSPPAADCIHKLTGGRITPHVVMNGINPNRATPAMGFSRELKRQNMGVSPGTLVFIMVATLFNRKDHPTLFRAFAKALPQLGDARLWLVGDGDQRAPLEALAASLGIAENTVFLGIRSDVIELLAASDVFVLSSHIEGIPISLIEAAFTGLPIIATELGGLAYLQRQGLPILLVKERDVTDLCNRLLEMLDNSRRSALASSLRSSAHGLFLIQRAAEDYMQLYRRLSPAN
jgi:glycosyltransferase involved in cell wall biosynthesis